MGEKIEVRGEVTLPHRGDLEIILRIPKSALKENAPPEVIDTFGSLWRELLKKFGLAVAAILLSGRDFKKAYISLKSHLEEWAEEMAQ